MAKKCIADLADEMADEGKAIIQAALLVQLGRVSEGKEVLKAAIEKLAWLDKQIG